MLFYLFIPKENQAPLKGIYANGHFRMRLDDLPGFLHAFTPINIVENKNGIIMNMIQTLVKVIKGGFFLMIAIKKNKVIGFIS